MCAHTGHQKEMVGGYTADVLECLALGGAYDIHHLVGVCPFLALVQHLLKELLTVGVLGKLEVVASLVAGKCKQDDPFAFIAQEGSNTVLAHIGGNGYGVHVDFFKERAGIHGTGVADVAALGVGDNHLLGVVLVEILDGLLE